MRLRCYRRHAVAILLVGWGAVIAWLAWSAWHKSKEDRVLSQVSDRGGLWETWSSSDLQTFFLKKGRVCFLDLRRCRIDAEMLRSLYHLQFASIVDLSECGLSDRDFREFRGPARVKRLRLDGNPLTDQSVNKICEYTNIRILQLRETQIGNIGLESISKLPLLEQIDLSGTNVTSSGISNLQNIKGLTTLNLSNTKVDDEAVDFLAHMKSLTTLTLDGTRLTEEGYDELRLSLPSTHIFFRGQREEQ